MLEKPPWSPHVDASRNAQSPATGSKERRPGSPARLFWSDGGKGPAFVTFSSGVAPSVDENGCNFDMSCLVAEPKRGISLESQLAGHAAPHHQRIPPDLQQAQRAQQPQGVTLGSEQVNRVQRPQAGIEGYVVPDLIRCAERGDIPAMLQLLAGGADPNCRDELGLTALHGAAKKGHVRVVSGLIACGADINACSWGWRGETPLHYACKYGHIEVVQMLLSHRADPGFESHEGRSPLDYAKSKKHAAILTLLATPAS